MVWPGLKKSRQDAYNFYLDFYVRFHASFLSFSEWFLHALKNKGSNDDEGTEK